MRRQRRSIRLRSYDYTRAGAYFVTLCTKDRECIFGEAIDGQVRLTDMGRVADECWSWILQHFKSVLTDAYVVMPNHLHGVLVVEYRDVWAQHAAPLPKPTGVNPGSLAAVVRSFKSAAAKRINEIRDTPGAPVWQRNYFEHIIRDELSMERIRQYIIENPMRWPLDRENPIGHEPDMVIPFVSRQSEV